MTWKNEKKSKALLVVFGIYLALLVWCILFKFALRPEEIPHLRGINLIPYAIDNTLGAVIGILLYLGMKKIWKEKTGKIITILGAVLEVLFLALLFFTFAANRMF